ncbi:shikimate kinase [Mucilaginibacter phyllosphaerae]|uniref:Shikimate kinase n=1 Tax=Mucilaginibacter phyllosphaerae TaxID=1812349 RepID=A0A4Y8AAP2_9SPHI|nr:shikimate kinase [Mucilaginibacter phyllosphaerae]MBB3969557.1 shikimate kinase [Mucilaginibacter phyllosphaerae]TEW64949.1 shikimate kinase [Mucilaginibacter phyllosphaerae]GGH18939.1 shikimate kinase [Mucilaginibacter phyllosphaerae]
MGLIFLVGFMGCGKTSWGRKLAAGLDYEFIDLDHALEAQAGLTIAEYFTSYGEEAFRKLESEILKTTDYPENTIISTGGGLPCFFDNIDWMNSHGQTLYIQLSPKALGNRLENAKTQRPVLQDKKGNELVKFIEQKLAEREGFYLKATHIVNGIDMSVEKLIEVLD